MHGPEWQELRDIVIKRDRGRCINCRRSGDDVESLDVHHIVPEGRGGADRLRNLALLCRQCHDAVHNEEDRAPRLTWKGCRMDEDEFQLYRRLMKALDITKFDGDEKCWYIPKADAMKVLGVDDDESDLEVDHADRTIPIAEFM